MFETHPTKYCKSCSNGISFFGQISVLLKKSWEKNLDFLELLPYCLQNCTTSLTLSMHPGMHIIFVCWVSLSWTAHCEFLLLQRMRLVIAPRPAEPELPAKFTAKASPSSFNQRGMRVVMAIIVCRRAKFPGRLF